MEKHQDCRMDLVKALALLFVICLHFFYNGSFYDTPVEGSQMLVMVIMRSALMICVPLFIMSSGYLSRHFEWDRKLLVRFIRVLLAYLLSACCCLAFRVLVQHESFGAPALLKGIKQLIQFTAAPYGWYVKMHLGLMLMMPFLNIIVRCATRRQMRSCVISLGLLTMLPYVLPRHSFFDYWVGLYPVFYYMLGAYLAEHRVALDSHRKRGTCLIALTAIVLIWGIYNFFVSWHRCFLWEIHSGYNGVVIAAMTCLFFLLAHSVPVEKMPEPVQKLLRWISGLTLPAYLLSYCFDQCVYPGLKAMYPAASQQLAFFPVVTLFVFVASLLAAQAVAWCVSLLMKPVRRLILRETARNQ